MSNLDYISAPELARITSKFESKTFFIIPPYQRTYAWNKDRVLSFWDELLIPDNKSQYNLSFSGSIILKHNNITDPDNQYEIIDGQQRFITISIFLALIRDFSEFLLKTKHKKNSKVSEFYYDIMSNTKDQLRLKKVYQNEAKPRIRVGKVIRDYYDKIIVDSNGYENNLNTTLTSLKNESEKNILRNYKTFSDKLIEYIKEHDKTESNEHEVIISLLESLDKIDVIQINVTDDVAAYEIFETVNSKNEPLTSSDLIKNQILRSLDQKDEYENKWNESIANISQVDGFNFNQFLRYYWISKYSWSTDKKLYANFKFYLNDQFKNKNERSKFLKNFLDEILTNSLHFRRLLNPEFDDYYNQLFSHPQHYDKKIINSLNTIKDLNIKQCYVLLLSIIRNAVEAKKKLKDKKRYDRIARSVSIMFKTIETFSLQFHSLGKGQANKVEKSIYHNFAVEIEKLSSKALGDNKLIKNWTLSLKDSLSLKLDNILSNENIDLELVLSRLDYSKRIDYFIIKYIFEKITQYNYNSKNFSFNEYSTVEHILPQNPSKWKLNPKDVQSYVNKIGNLIIIERDLNRAMGNQTLEKKINGFTFNGKERSYFEDKCNYNKNLFRKIKRDLNKKAYSNNGVKYWDRSRIEKRIKLISEEFSSAIQKYNES